MDVWLYVCMHKNALQQDAHVLMNASCTTLPSSFLPWLSLLNCSLSPSHFLCSQEDLAAMESNDDKKKKKKKKAKRKKEQNINVRAAFIHVIGDLFQSVGVVIAGYIIWFKVRWWVMWCYLMSCDVMWCHVMSCDYFANVYSSHLCISNYCMFIVLSYPHAMWCHVTIVHTCSKTA